LPTESAGQQGDALCYSTLVAFNYERACRPTIGTNGFYGDLSPSRYALQAFHYNQDFGAALSEFLRVLIDEFEFLQENQSTLSPALSAELERFRQYLEPA